MDVDRIYEYIWIKYSYRYSSFIAITTEHRWLWVQSVRHDIQRNILRWSVSNIFCLYYSFSFFSATFSRMTCLIYTVGMISLYYGLAFLQKIHTIFIHFFWKRDLHFDYASVNFIRTFVHAILFSLLSVAFFWKLKLVSVDPQIRLIAQKELRHVGLYCGKKHSCYLYMWWENDHRDQFCFA